MKLRMADRIAGQLFNTLNTLMQRVAVNAQPLGGPDHVAALLKQRFQRLQQQPGAFAIRLNQAAEGVVHKIAQQGGVANGGEQLDKPQLPHSSESPSSLSASAISHAWSQVFC